MLVQAATGISYTMTTGLPPGRVETGTTFNCFVKDFWQHVAIECNFAVKNKSLYIVLV